MGLTMEDVKYRIISDYDVPEIYIRGEKAWVVSCSTQYVTRGADNLPNKTMTASIYLDSEMKNNNRSAMHTVFIDSTLERIFFE